MNNRGADQTALMLRLVCTFVVRIPQKTSFLATRLKYLYVINFKSGPIDQIPCQEFRFSSGARLFINALWSTAGKGLTSWLSFGMSNCEVE